MIFFNFPIRAKKIVITTVKTSFYNKLYVRIGHDATPVVRMWKPVVCFKSIFAVILTRTNYILFLQNTHFTILCLISPIPRGPNLPRFLVAFNAVIIRYETKLETHTGLRA